jgi:hypothetical protein
MGVAMAEILITDIQISYCFISLFLNIVSWSNTGQADDVLGTGPGLREQPDDPSQRHSNLPGHIGLVLPLLVATGLASEHDPSAGTIDCNAVRKAARF